MKIRTISNNWKVVIEWAEGEDYKIKRLHKKLDMADIMVPHLAKIQKAGGAKQLLAKNP